MRSWRWASSWPRSAVRRSAWYRELGHPDALREREEGAHEGDDDRPEDEPDAAGPARRADGRADPAARDGRGVDHPVAEAPPVGGGAGRSCAGGHPRRWPSLNRPGRSEGWAFAGPGTTGDPRSRSSRSRRARSRRRSRRGRGGGAHAPRAGGAHKSCDGCSDGACSTDSSSVATHRFLLRWVVRRGLVGSGSVTDGSGDRGSSAHRDQAASRSAARSRALRARGFAATSAAVGVSDGRVTSRSRGALPHTQPAPPADRCSRDVRPGRTA